jgi:hypothetical protein
MPFRTGVSGYPFTTFLSSKMVSAAMSVTVPYSG